MQLWQKYAIIYKYLIFNIEFYDNVSFKLYYSTDVWY